MPHWRIGACVIILALTLAACGGSDEGPQHTPAPPDTPASTVNPTRSAARETLERAYERLRAANEAIGTVWESLAAGRQVRCGTSIETLPPGAIAADVDPTLDPAARHLRDAAVALDQAERLWQSECANPRPQPPADVINQGRLAIRQADVALDAAASELGIE